jgi:hypothetical protein
MRVHAIIEETIQSVVCLSCFTVVVAVFWQVIGVGGWFH